MAEYIEKNFALDVVRRTSGDYAAAFEEIAHATIADVIPVAHGEWRTYAGSLVACSVCVMNILIILSVIIIVEIAAPRWI